MTNIAPTSRDALRSVSLRYRKSVTQVIFDVVVAAARNGIEDMSMKEIQKVLHEVHGMRVDMSSISARANELVVAGKLLRDPNKRRACRCSEPDRPIFIGPLSAPAQQTRAFY